MKWIGVDVGGTFTDIVTYDAATGELRSDKCPSTPDDPPRGVLEAVRASGVPLAEVDRFRHGATVATNTALERAGAVLGVITTAGFRDVLIVGRGHREKLYDIKATRPEGLVRRSRVIEVPERIGADGAVVTPLDEAAVRAAAATLRSMGAQCIAVCFLHAYANPSHEQRAAALVAQAAPEIPVSTSSEVLPEYREYERFATTALNAYVAPRMAGYLGRLRSRLADVGLPVVPEIMTSSGGSWPFERMSRLPVNSMLSGPAAGVIGAAAVARALGREDVITCDMGGTSTDTCMIRAGRYGLASEGRIGGFPNRAPQIEINTVGAGGGSIAWLDVGGFLNVGPRSAGAVPGPACYGRGGTEPTVTDANVVLGRFRPSGRLGGEIEVDVERAEAAVGALAARLELSMVDTARGILQIAVARMTGAIKEISVMRGLDPRDFALFAYGGAGALHASAIARELEMNTVIVPPLPGTFSALGLLMADRRRDFSRTRLVPLAGATLDEVKAMLEPLREAARRELEEEGFDAANTRFECSVDVRLIGQAFEITTPLADDAPDIGALERDFRALYEERYTHADEGAIEAVAFRVAAYGLTERPALPRLAAHAERAAPVTRRRIVFDDDAVDTPVYERDHLGAGERLEGPVAIEEAGAATLVPRGFSLECEPGGALVLTRSPSA